MEELPSPWFCEPVPLLPIPEKLKNNIKRTRPLPLTATNSTSNVINAPRKKKKKENEFTIPGVQHEGYARCEVSIRNEIIIVPYNVNDIDKNIKDDDCELLLVEMQTPNRDEWLNRSREKVLVATKLNYRYVLLDEIRRLVRERVNMDKKVIMLSRAVYKMCVPVKEHSSYVVTLIPVEDLKFIPFDASYPLEIFSPNFQEEFHRTEDPNEVEDR